MKAYAYNAAVYCERCGEKIKSQLAKPDYPEPWDTGDYPMPIDTAYTEADTPLHCDSCGKFLENSLTEDGLKYVRQAVKRDIAAGLLDSVAVKVWGPFYGMGEE